MYAWTKQSKVLHFSSLRGVDKHIGEQADRQWLEARGETRSELQGIHAHRPLCGIFHMQQNPERQFL